MTVRVLSAKKNLTRQSWYLSRQGKTVIYKFFCHFNVSLLHLSRAGGILEDPLHGHTDQLQAGGVDDEPDQFTAELWYGKACE